jgi:hypothetical protein
MRAVLERAAVLSGVDRKLNLEQQIATVGGRSRKKRTKEVHLRRGKTEISDAKNEESVG